LPSVERVHHRGTEATEFEIRLKMLPSICEWLRFEDGAEGIVDLSATAGHGVFSAWLDPAFFAQVFIDRDAGTIAWPGGLDLDPYVLYSEIMGASLPGAGRRSA
jgi:hypothetical protein